MLETIRLHGPITRAAIAKHVGLTIQTVSNIIRELEEQGFLLARRVQPRGRGQPATTLELDPEGGFAIGLHATPRGIEAALINLAGEIIGRDDYPHPQIDPDTAFEKIEGLVGRLSDLRPEGRMLGVGMAMPGPFGVESMSFVGPTTLQGWKDVPVRDRLAAATRLPAFIEVDLAAAAHGEHLYGLGNKFRDFYYLYFGVGLGGSMVHDGAALRGAWGNAGEIGHIPAIPGGDLCPCGNRGCLERYLSIEAYERRVDDIGEAAWLEEVAPILQSAVVTIENLFDPATIILGGLTPDNLLAKLIAAATPLPNSIAARGNRKAERLIPSQAGQDSVLLGAAALAVSGVLSPRFGILFTQNEDRADRDPIMRDAGKARAA